MLRFYPRLSPLLLLACSDYELGRADKAVGGTEPVAEAECAEVDTAPVGAVAIDEACTTEADPGGFDPQVEWRWDAASDAVGAPGYEDVMMTPVVGDVDGDGMPEVVFTAYASPNYGSAGALIILSGDGAGEEQAWTSIGGYAPFASSGVALGDLEGDGTPEIIVISADYRVLALHADGSLVWASEARSSDLSAYSYPSIADLDGDGLAEVIVGRAIFSSDGTTRGVGEYCMGGAYAISAVADLDGDGQQEVICGNAAYRIDGSAIYANGLADGWSAVGDFDGDGQGEVVSVDNGSVWLTDTEGSLIWSNSLVPGGGGGPPTVADFDGDGQPEVGVAGSSGYAVFDTDGSILWEAATTDASSARTGSSVFDFEGDGQWEVVYADEQVLWVYDGATGAPIMADDRHASWTLFEYPIIVDVDADGEAEIVLASNDSTSSGWQGITVIGDASGSWAPTTATWNQHAYHITNVEDDLSIPASPVMNWLLGHNSYRAGGLRERPGIPSPNLSIQLVDICWACEEPAVSLTVQVTSTGTEDLSGTTDVAFYLSYTNGDIVLAEVQQVAVPVAGLSSASLSFSAALPDIEHTKGVIVRVDDPGTTGAAPTSGAFDECDEDDNSLTEVPEGCE